jgi:GNAT superfamily N-acetyltransferase
LGVVEVRCATVEDADAIVRLGREIAPDELATVETFRGMLARSTAPQTERLVAEVAGVLVAWAPSGRYASGVGWLGGGVASAHRRRGIGTALYERIEQRLRTLGADRLETAADDEDGRRFLLARGFEVANVQRRSELDPRRATMAPAVPPGIAVKPLAQVLDRPRLLYDLYSEARADTPSSEPRTPWTFEEWHAETLQSPLLDLDASVVVLDNDEPISFAWLLSDREGGRAETLMAGTRRDLRGTGLATLAKVESTRRAAALGIRRILTDNDNENAPMLAINRKLGFLETAVVQSLAKHL